MAKKKITNKYAFAKSVLRRASTWWWALSEAMDRAKVGRGLWECAMCHEHFKKNEVQRDHIKPVVSTDGEKNDMNMYIETLFCEPENIQILCKPCHQAKSQTENEIRKENRKKKAKEYKAALKKSKELQEKPFKFSKKSKDKITKDVIESIMKDRE
jgi:5-methylcytosine-specific restriction endonuclease McrA